MKAQVRDFEIDKEELDKTVIRHNTYIDELVQAVKDRDDVINELEEEKSKCEEDIAMLKTNNDKVRLRSKMQNTLPERDFKLILATLGH